MTVELATEVASRVGAPDEVVAVALGGSLGRGRADRHADVDLAVYYDPARPFSLAEFRALVTELDDRHAPEVVGFGDWGPWINGGAWARIQGAKVDLLYRDLALVDRVLDDCAAGRTTCSYQPGHPHGFHSHAYAAYVHHNLVLRDPDGALAAGAAARPRRCAGCRSRPAARPATSPPAAARPPRPRWRRRPGRGYLA